MYFNDQVEPYSQPIKEPSVGDVVHKQSTANMHLTHAVIL